MRLLQQIDLIPKVRPYTLTFSVFVLFGIIANLPAQVYVDVNAPGGGDGTSWAAAYNSIQVAIDDAASQGGEIWIARGTYSETIVLSGDRHLYGGFESGDMSLDDRDSAANPTIIDASTLPAPSHVVFGMDLSNITLDGLTITGGSATGASNPDDRGGGLYIFNVQNFTMNNCIVASNSAGQAGAGYFITVTGTVTDCRIQGNVARRADRPGANAGFVCAIDCDMDFIRCLFTENIAEFVDNDSGLIPGGAGLAVGLATVDLIDCEIINNQAWSASAISVNSTSSFTMTNGRVAGNTGNPIFISGFNEMVPHATFNNVHIEDNNANIAPNYSQAGAANISFGAMVEFNDCVIQRNIATEGSTSARAGAFLNTSATIIARRCLIGWNETRDEGGALVSEAGDNTFEDCVIVGHRLSEVGADSAEGGAIAMSSGTTNLTRCVIADNMAYFGGGVAARGGVLNVNDTIIAGNHSYNNGGGIYTQDTAITVTNSIIAGNTMVQSGGGVYCTGDQQRMIFANSLFYRNLNAVDILFNRQEFMNCQFVENDGAISEVNANNSNADVYYCLFYNNARYAYRDTYEVSGLIIEEVYNSGALMNGVLDDSESEGNLDGDPLFHSSMSPSAAGVWKSVEPGARTTRLVAEGDPFGGRDLRGRVIDTNTTTGSLTLSVIVSNTANSVTVSGDGVDAAVGAAFRLLDFRHRDNSPAIDNGIGVTPMSFIMAPDDDREGRPRPNDIPILGDGGFGDGTDIGPYEYYRVTIPKLVDHILGRDTLSPTEAMDGDLNMNAQIESGDVILKAAE